MGPGGIAFTVGGGTLLVSCVAIYISVRLHHYRTRKLQNLGCNNISTQSLPISTDRGNLFSDFALGNCICIRLKVDV